MRSSVRQNLRFRPSSVGGVCGPGRRPKERAAEETESWCGTDAPARPRGRFGPATPLSVSGAELNSHGDATASALAAGDRQPIASAPSHLTPAYPLVCSDFCPMECVGRAPRPKCFRGLPPRRAPEPGRSIVFGSHVPVSEPRLVPEISGRRGVSRSARHRTPTRVAQGAHSTPAAVVRQCKPVERGTR